jgi:hypothetical protein
MRSAEDGADVVKRGEHLPTRRTRSRQDPVFAEPAASMIVGNGGPAADPASVRPLLAEAAALNLDAIKHVLVETATGATKPVWFTVTCKHCERPGRYEVVVPDHRVRLDAVEALLHQGFGRPAQSEVTSGLKLPATAAQVERMSWHDLQTLASTVLVDEIEAVARGGGDRALRDRLAQLSETECDALRTALAETAIA